MLAKHVGVAMNGCSWVGVPFAGGMSELPHIKARTILVNDLHRHVINLARVVADDELRPQLVRSLSRDIFHPDRLRASQDFCQTFTSPGGTEKPCLALAAAYFRCCWMGRSSKAGIKDEFNGRPSIRWRSDGGDSMVRYMSALRMVVPFSQTLRRCTFETIDAFDFLGRCEDRDGHGIYCDPPFPGVGRRYKHNCGKKEAEEKAWHTRLRDTLERFGKARIVCRFYEHPLINELYQGWAKRYLAGRTQANKDAGEILFIRNPTPDTLFSNIEGGK